MYEMIYASLSLVTQYCNSSLRRGGGGINIYFPDSRRNWVHTKVLWDSMGYQRYIVSVDGKIIINSNCTE